MSEGHEHDDDDAADAHDDHGFDGEPATELGPDEPQTPGWVPAVGAAIFVLAGIFFLVERKDAEQPAAGAAEAAPQIVATAVPRPAQPGARPVPVQPGARGVPGQPGANGAAAPGGGAAPGAAAPANRLSPDQMRELQKRLKEAADKKAAAAPGAP